MSDIVERLRADNLLELPGAGIIGACREAADIIESLRQQLEMAEACLAGDNALIIGLKNDIAEKDAEIERLKTVPMKYRRMAFNAQLQDENRELEKQLAASQAREAQLREALEDQAHWLRVNQYTDFEIQEALAIPADTSALEAVKAEVAAKAGEAMRERCAVECEQRQMAYATAGYERHAQATAGLSDAIRALPGVTLEDLKK